VATTDEPAARSRPSKATTAKIARAYLAAINEHDVEAAVAYWAPGGRETIHGQIDAVAPDGVREYFGGLLASVPDLRLTELSCTAEADRCAIRSRMTGTFAGTAPLFGVKPNGARIDLEIVDNFVVADGKIVANDAYVDGMTVARQLGLLPPDGSTTQTALTRAFNVKTKAAAKTVSDLEKAAEGVWRLRGGFPAKDFNVYFIEEDDGVTVFDAGIRAMTNAVAAAGARLGGIKRVVLGHAHPDHRGVASGLGAPVLCHPAERADAEGDGGEHYFHLERLNFLVARAYPRLLKMWDGGPVPIADTLDEGDEIAGFQVVHVPGHAPGMIALWRPSDRVALTTDAFYLLDPQTGVPKREPTIAHVAFNDDTDAARESLRKLAALDPAVCWPGHLGPLTGDVRGALERAASAS
jgi:glyoxylase-like metal-dependent hydrolase (beta-lactamase superfamily II)/predicted ester cyclase